MPITVFGQNSVYNANTFAASFARDSIYLYVGKSSAWSVDSAPGTVADSGVDRNKIWDNMSGAIRVTPNQVALGIKRNNWTSGIIYEKYSSSDATLGTGTGFAVLAGYNDRDVYKCLDNNGGSPSTVKPSHKSSGVVQEADDYAWKYMYTITTSAFSRFATSNVIPVIENREISLYSVPGSILHVPISANSATGIGKEYRGTGFSNGTVGFSTVNATIFTSVFSDSSTNEIKVIADSGLAIVEDYYSNTMFLVTSGVSKGKMKEIVFSKPPTTLALSDDNRSNLVFSTPITNIANGDSFIIGPLVSARNDLSGSGYAGVARVNSYGNVTSIETISSGAGYSQESLMTVHGDYLPTTNAFSDGSGAVVSVVTAPVTGHGYRSGAELNAKFAIVSAETTIPTTHETGSFIGYGNEIRQYGLVRNPISAYTGRAAKESSYDLRTTLYFKNPTVVPFNRGDTVNNALTTAATTATGIIDNICGASGEQYISLVNAKGQFSNGDVIYNQMGYSMTIHSASLVDYYYPAGSLVHPGLSVIGPGLYKYSGELLYNENITPITRRNDQKENFKIVFEF